jgi:hypothetical protein
MKKFSIAPLLLVFSIYASAQDLVIKGTKKIDKTYTPQQVMDSIQKRFPNAKSVQYYQTTPEAAQRGWTVATEDELDPNAVVDYYTVAFKQEGLQYYGLYDKDGNLVECKIEQKVDQLPEPVVTSLKAIAKDYPGYKVVSKNYYKKQNYSKNKEYYEVTAKNGKNEKRFYYTEAGELIKVK